MINKQNSANPSVVDPNLNSKIESLKKQNDYLFMCKFKTVFPFVFFVLITLIPVFFQVVLAGCILAGVVALVAAGVCWYT